MMTDHAEAVRNFYRRQGAEEERNRIIEILKSDLCERPDFKLGMSHPGECYPDIAGLDRIIEIITGDKK